MIKLNTRERFEKFHETVQELKSTGLMKKGLSSNMKIKVEGSEMRFETEWPHEDDDDLRSFLMTFRHFVANKEDMFLYKIFNLCHRKLTDKKLRENLAEARMIWKKAHETVGFNILRHGKKQTSEWIVKLWLSGKYFHKDEEKRSELKGLPHTLAIMYRHQFLSYLVEATRIIFYVDKVIARVLEESLYKD